MGRKNLRDIIWILTFLCICLCGCNNKTSDLNREIKMQDSYVWAEGPIEEYNIPAYDEIVSSLNLSLVAESKTSITDYSLWKRIITKEENGNNKAFFLYYLFDEQQWKFVSPYDGTTKDNVAYVSLIQIDSSLNGQYYAILKLNEEQYGLASFEYDYSNQYISDICQYTSDSHMYIAVGKDEKVYEYINPELKISSSDIKTNATKIICLSGERKETIINGYVLGCVQKDKGSEILFYGTNQERCPAMWDIDGKEKKIEFPQEISSIEFLVTYDENGMLIFADVSGIWESDGSTSTRLCSFMENGIQLDSVEKISCGDGRNISILAKKDGKETVITYDLSKKDIKAEKQGIVLAMSQRNPAFNSIVADFNRYDHDYYVTVIYPNSGESLDDFKRRIQMEISGGKGPDLLDGSVLNDVSTMISKGFLKAIDDELFSEVGCLESAIETGKQNGKLYGVPYEFSLSFVAYRKSDFGKVKSLTVDKLIKTVENSGYDYLAPDCSGMDIVTHYALYDESNTDYIDWAKRKSNLTDRKFIELLEFAQKYMVKGEDYYTTFSKAVAKSYAGGDANTFYLRSFNTLETYLKGYVILGYPRKSGKGIYMWTNRIYTNSKSKNGEGTKRFLKYITGERAQALYVSYNDDDDLDRYMNSDGFYLGKEALFSINRHALETFIVKEDGNNPDNQYVLETGKVLYLKTPLTDAQIELFWDMVDNALPASFMVSAIEDVFSEELELFFEGQITAEEAAKRLDNRVQTYLYETD